MFIELTEMPRERKLMINAGLILYYCKSQFGSDIYVKFACQFNSATNGEKPNNGTHIFVRESVEEIADILNARSA